MTAGLLRTVRAAARAFPGWLAAPPAARILWAARASGVRAPVVSPARAFAPPAVLPPAVLPLALALAFVPPALVSPAAAQPDPRQMSGIPLPDGQLPVGTVSVRVIRGGMTNNVPDHPVELRRGDAVRSDAGQGEDVQVAVTDAAGRATFADLPPGVELRAATELDGVRLESQPFTAPTRGGTRLLLVGAAPGGAADPAAPVEVEAGEVTFGTESRIAVELGEESLTVFYHLQVVNRAAAPVDSGHPLQFMLPADAQGATALADSAPGTRVEGRSVLLPGPFAPGATPLLVAYVLPYTGGRTTLAQALPADLEALFVVVEKWGEMSLTSEQVSRRADMGPDAIGGDTTYIFGAGPRVAAGAPMTFEISGLPHHSRTPALTTMALAVLLLLAGVWGAAGSGAGDEAGRERRRRLEARRERLFAELVTLERQRQAGRVGATKHASRRAALVAALEGVCRDLDADPAPLAPGPVRPLPPSPAAARPAGPAGAAG